MCTKKGTFAIALSQRSAPVQEKLKLDHEDMNTFTAPGSFSIPLATLLVTTPLPGLAFIMAGMSLAPRPSSFLPLLAALGLLVDVLVGARELGQRHAARLPDAALDVDRAQQAVERVHRHRAVGAARVHRRARPHPHRDLRRRLAHGARHAHDLRRGNRRFLLGPGRRAVLELQVPPLHDAVGLLLREGRLVHRLAGDEQVLPVLEVADELAAPHAFGEDHVRDGAGQRAVGARVERQPFLRLGRHVRQPRVDRDHRAALHDLAEAVDDVRHHAVGGQRVAAPGHQAVGLVEVVVAVAEEALREARAHLLGFGADGAVREVVGRAEDLGQRAVEQVRGGRRVAPAHVDELVRLVRRAQRDHLLGDGVERLVPGDGHELRVDAAALGRVGALHRHLDAVGIVDLLRDHVAARADVAVVGLAERVAAHPGRPAALHEDLDGAPLGAALAGGGHPLALGGARGLGLAQRHGARDRDLVPRRRAAGGQRAGERGRCPEEFPSRQFHVQASLAVSRAGVHPSISSLTYPREQGGMRIHGHFNSSRTRKLDLSQRRWR